VGTKGLSSSGGTISINFNFTFTNAPKVVATIRYSIDSTQLWTLVVSNVTTTGFSAIASYAGTGSSTINPYIIPFNWIAIG